METLSNFKMDKLREPLSVDLLAKSHYSDILQNTPPSSPKSKGMFTSYIYFNILIYK